MSRRLQTGVLVAAVLGGLAAVWILGFWQYAKHDRIDLIDDPVVAGAAEEACRDLHTGVRRLEPPAGAAGGALAAAIRRQNAEVDAMIGRIERTGRDRLRDDRPAADWLSDWRLLIEARESYARDVSRGLNRPLRVPQVDGQPITDRMDDVGLDCTVPRELLGPRSITR